MEPMALLRSVLLLLCICHLLPLARTAFLKFFPCDTDPKSSRVDCSKRGLTQVPLINSQSVVSLNLDENRIWLVENNAFTGLPNLQYLSLSWNCLPSKLKSPGSPPCQMVIEPNAFVNLKKLRHLFLAGNSLTKVPKLTAGLQYLSIEINKIFNITSPLGAPNLRQLNLNKNCFFANPCNQSFYIKEDVLKEMQHLQNLTLGFNNLTVVPSGLPWSLESLDLRENKISEIKEADFANLTRLWNLNLEWNCQRCDHAAQPCFPCPHNASIRLHPKAFQSQGNLNSLSLRGNSLKNLSESLFVPLTSLSRLDLSDNLLAYVIRNGTFFKHLKNVTSLNLLYNYQPLKTFANLYLSKYMEEMTLLEDLYISGYFFLELAPRGLRPLLNLRHLQSLDFRMNFINKVNMSIFSHMKALKKVVLSQNMLAFSPSCKQGIDQLDNQDQSVGERAPLVLQDLGRNQKDSVAKWDQCHQVPEMWMFQKNFCQGHLFFDLSQNNILSIKEDIFLGIEKAVCLDLSSNYISQPLDGRQFSPLKNLSYLNLAHNRIDLYYPNAFKELATTLKVLDLTHNEYHFLMKGMGHRFEFLRHLMSLEVLSLSENNIGIRISTRLHSSSLKYLYFSGNRLEIMWDSKFDQYLHFFTDLTSLIFLDISRNQLTSFPPEALCNLPKTLESLKVNDNHLTFFPWNHLIVLRNLNYLNLSYNSLSSLPKEMINFGPILKVLDLSHNKINWIPEVFFLNATALRCILLNNNKLKLLSSQNLPSPLLQNLSHLTLHANPFTCTCDSSWFTEFLKTTNITIPHLIDLRCEFPESQLGEHVLSMDPRSCQEIYGSIGFLCTFLLTSAFLMVSLLKKLYGWDLWYSIQVFWAGKRGYSLLPGGESQYDAFVVFDTRNAAVTDWVYNDLRVNLEDKGRQRFKLCFEERDWVPGVACIQNLHNSVYSSKKTVFVLASGSSVSGILRQAFFMVQQRLLDEKVDVVVLVLLDKVFYKSRYLQMRKILCRKSVLTWPMNPHAHQHFWNSMKTILASDNCKYYDSNVNESFLINNLV
ncbi:toll-like receptor 9 [Lepisosteus oculatus]|uniref:toll-like receptor 9 n=1 Tax=Lepisosteus oculatus TaxID=7918 RepID=UPI00371D0CA7